MGTYANTPLVSPPFFDTDLKKGVGHGLFQFIEVGTPADEDGPAHLRMCCRSQRVGLF